MVRGVLSLARAFVCVRARYYTRKASNASTITVRLLFPAKAFLLKNRPNRRVRTAVSSISSVTLNVYTVVGRTVQLVPRSVVTCELATLNIHEDTG